MTGEVFEDILLLAEFGEGKTKFVQASHLPLTRPGESQVVGEKIGYGLKGKDVIEVRTPVYAKRTEQEWHLKAGVRFDTETGRFFLKKVPTEQEVEAAARSQFNVGLPQWVKDRM
jgi:hypothetical protein